MTLPMLIAIIIASFIVFATIDNKSSATQKSVSSKGSRPSNQTKNKTGNWLSRYITNGALGLAALFVLYSLLGIEERRQLFFAVIIGALFLVLILFARLSIKEWKRKRQYKYRMNRF